MQYIGEKIHFLESDAVDAQRRRAIQKIAVSVGALAGYSILPDEWTKPILGQILLPAHAATSGSALNDPCQVKIQAGSDASENVTVRVTGFVTPPVANLPTLVIATAVGGSNSMVQEELKTAEDGTFKAFLTVGGGPGITSIEVETRVTGATGIAQCQVTTESDGSDNNHVSGNFSWQSQALGMNGNGSGSPDTLSSIVSSLTDFLVADAKADSQGIQLPTNICVHLEGDGTASAVMMIDGLHPGPWDGNGTITNGIMMPFKSDTLIIPPDTYLVVRFYIRFVSVASDQVVVDIDVDGGDTVLANLVLTSSNDSCNFFS